MFERSGEKIRTVGKVIFYMMVAIAVLVLFVGLFGAASTRYGGGVAMASAIISAAAILLSAWISSLFLIAFGDLVDSNEKIVELLQQIINGEYRRISPSENNNDTKDSEQ